MEEEDNKGREETVELAEDMGRVMNDFTKTISSLQLLLVTRALDSDEGEGIEQMIQEIKEMKTTTAELVRDKFKEM